MSMAKDIPHGHMASLSILRTNTRASQPILMQFPAPVPHRTDVNHPVRGSLPLTLCRRPRQTLRGPCSRLAPIKRGELRHRVSHREPPRYRLCASLQTAGCPSDSSRTRAAACLSMRCVPSPLH